MSMMDAIRLSWDGQETTNWQHVTGSSGQEYLFGLVAGEYVVVTRGRIHPDAPILAILSALPARSLEAALQMLEDQERAALARQDQQFEDERERLRMAASRQRSKR